MRPHPYKNENGVFINRLSINDADELRRVEYSITASKSVEIDSGLVDLPYGFGLERLCAIHKYLFEEIYDWAGTPRNVRSSKSMGISGLVSLFAEPQDIKQNWKKLENIAENFILQKGLNFEEKVKDLTSIYAKANYNHVFVEGNTRSLQIFMKQLAKTQNIELDFSKIKNKSRWLEACGVSGFHGELVYGEDGGKYLEPLPPNIKPLTDIFFEIASEIKPAPSSKPSSKKKGFGM